MNNKDARDALDFAMSEEEFGEKSKIDQLLQNIKLQEFLDKEILVLEESLAKKSKFLEELINKEWEIRSSLNLREHEEFFERLEQQTNNNLR